MFIEEHKMIVLLLPVVLLHYIKYKQVQFSFSTIYLNIFTETPIQHKTSFNYSNTIG